MMTASIFDGSIFNAVRFSLSTAGFAPVSKSTACSCASTRQAKPHTAFTPGTAATELSTSTVRRAVEAGASARAMGTTRREKTARMSRSVAVIFMGPGDFDGECQLELFRAITLSAEPAGGSVARVFLGGRTSE